MAFKYWMDASWYLPSAEYFSPLSRYFCLRTLGSREHPVNIAVRRQQASSRRRETEPVIWDSPTANSGSHARVFIGKHLMILQGNRAKQLPESYANRSGGVESYQRGM